MGVLTGLLLGAGLACVWSSLWVRPARAVRHDGVPARWQDALVQAGMAGVRPGHVAAAGAVLGLVTALVVLAAVRVPAVAACFGAFAAAVPVLVVQGRARRRRTRVRALWPDVVDHLASAVRAGMTVPEALAQVGERGPAELRAPFVAFAEDHRATGRFTESLDALKARLADPVADRIVEALRLTRDVGGTDLGRLLRTLSAFLRDDLRTRGELEARQSWTVHGARLAVAAPWLVLALLSSRPEAAVAYRTPAGATVLLVGLVCSVVAYAAMVRLGRLPDDPRVLR
ncbi:type II secretion system F family protein [Cellulomonas marina]|uniref:Tight adherence protein B n=1 Tax=Cellulomonas marina TaxID=988821 RepID=A0A1I0V1E5_9CELL|nr:type II secretion system F family protein [Cellulomonas marina]GIG28262.1 type II secretion system protein F [Cellulomonas marina]SFA70144.1 tight adherence protein B [Cellulomonas marina]